MLNYNFDFTYYLYNLLKVLLMNKNNPLVSICIPVFNGSDYIKECIDSVLDQNYTNFELVIVDNNSTDNTNLRKNFKDKRIRYIKNSKNIVE